MSGAPVIPEIHSREGFNLARLGELCDNPVLAALDHRIETDRFGHIIMTPPPGFDQGGFQDSLGKLIEQGVLGAGKIATETPISTSEGVRAADLVWICDMEGRLFIYFASAPDEPARSTLCPSCPERVDD